MTNSRTKTISARVDLTILSDVQAALRPDEKNSDFLIAAIRHELARRRTSSPRQATLGELGELSQAGLDKAASNHALLRLVDSKLGRIMKELDIE